MLNGGCIVKLNLWYHFCWKLIDPRVHVDLVVKINVTASATNQISDICVWPDTLLTAWHFHDFCKFEWEHQYKQRRTYCDLSYASEFSTCFTTCVYKWIRKCVNTSWARVTYLTKLQECYVVKENGVENVHKHQNYHLLLKNNICFRCCGSVRCIPCPGVKWQVCILSVSLPINQLEFS